MRCASLTVLHFIRAIVSARIRVNTSCPCRYTSADEMHQAVFSCLVSQGKEHYSVFLTFRATSDKLLAQLVFDALNHRWESDGTFVINEYYADTYPFLFLVSAACSITPRGNRVTVHWDPLRIIRGEEHFNQNVISGLLSSLCIVPILSHGAMAPLAAMSKDGWA